MKIYNKKELLEILENVQIFHDEISESRGFILTVMKENAINVPVDKLLVPNMSAWAIPFLYMVENELTTKQKEILKLLSNGKNYWIKSGLVPLSIPKEKYIKDLSMDDKLLETFLVENLSVIENKIKLHQMARSLVVEPIKSVDELHTVLEKLTKFYKELHVIKSEEKNFDGKSYLINSICSAISTGGLALTKSELLSINRIWTYDLSKELFPSQYKDIVLDIIENNLNTLYNNYKIFSSENYSIKNKKFLMQDMITHCANDETLKNLLYQLNNNKELRNMPRLEQIIQSYLKKDTTFVFLTQKIFSTLNNYNLIKDKSIDYSDKKNILNVEYWKTLMESQSLDKLPFTYFWNISTLLEDEESLFTEKNEDFIDFLKSNINWSDFKNDLTNRLLILEDYDSWKVSCIMLLKVYDKLKFENNLEYKIIEILIKEIEIKVINTNNKHDDTLGYVRNYLDREFNKRGLKKIEKIQKNITKDELLNSSWLLDSNSIHLIQNREMKIFDVQILLDINTKHNPNGIKDLLKNLPIINIDFFKQLLTSQSKSKNFKNYCNQYLLKIWNELTPDMALDIKNGEYLLLDKELFKNKTIDNEKAYNNAYSLTLNCNRKNMIDYTVNYEYIFNKLDEINKYSINEKFKNLVLIVNNVDNNNIIDNIVLLNKITQEIDLPKNLRNNIILALIKKGFTNDEMILSIEDYRVSFCKKYSNEDYYILLDEIKKELVFSYDEKKKITNLQKNIALDPGKLFDKLGINNFIQLIGNQELNFNYLKNEKIDAELLKKIADNMKNINTFNNVRYDQVFNVFLDFKVDLIKRDNVNIKNMSQEIEDFFIKTLDDVKDNPVAYLLLWSSAGSLLLESWKYNKLQSSQSNEYKHIFFNEYADIDIFNQGIKNLSEHISHLEYNDTQGYELFFKRMYHLTWETYKVKNSDNSDNVKKSLLSLEKKNKIWGSLQESNIDFLVTMNPANLNSDINNYSQLEIKDWNKIFKVLSNNSYSINQLEEVESTGDLLYSFLNYDAEDNFEVLQSLIHYININEYAKEVKVSYDYDGSLKNEYEVNPPIKDWYDVRRMKDSLLIRTLTMNEMRVKEITALYESMYLDRSIPVNNTKGKVFKL